MSSSPVLRVVTLHVPARLRPCPPPPLPPPGLGSVLVPGLFTTPGFGWPVIAVRTAPPSSVPQSGLFGSLWTRVSFGSLGLTHIQPSFGCSFPFLSRLSPGGSFSLPLLVEEELFVPRFEPSLRLLPFVSGMSSTTGGLFPDLDEGLFEAIVFELSSGISSTAGDLFVDLDVGLLLSGRLST